MWSVKVGGILYAVEQVHGLHHDEDKLSGSIGYNECVIRVEATDDVQAKSQTVWHEALHAIFHQAGREVKDHTVFDLLAYGVMQLLADNGALRCCPNDAWPQQDQEGE